MNKDLRIRAQSLCVAIAGALVFQLLGLPLPFLLGPIFACLIIALAGADLRGMRPVEEAMRTILGVAIGASITPALFHELPRMAASLALIPIFILLCALIGYPLLRRVFGLDHPTAWYSAMPGGLQDMLIFGIEAGANPRTLSLIQATRVLFIVSAAPVLLWLVWGVTLDAPPGAPIADTSPTQLALMAAAAIIGWRAAKAAGMFGASIFGPMIVAAILSLSGFLTMRPPAEAIWIAQVFIGLAVGVRYVGVTWRELRHDVTAGAVYCICLAAITVLFAESLYQIGLAPHLEAFLAFSPGGQAEMAIVALLAGADLAFVVSHHLVRIMVVIMLAPLAMRLWARFGK
ncbi:MAG: AbrB family transcriptional regulator [Paracoccaceae bacterium]